MTLQEHCATNTRLRAKETAKDMWQWAFKLMNAECFLGDCVTGGWAGHPLFGKLGGSVSLLAKRVLRKCVCECSLQWKSVWSGQEDLKNTTLAANLLLGIINVGYLCISTYHLSVLVYFFYQDRAGAKCVQDVWVFACSYWMHPVFTSAAYTNLVMDSLPSRWLKKSPED